MEKYRRVSVKASLPIYGVIDGPIYGYINEIRLSTEQIRKCIVQKASVKEILANGQYKELDLTNYHILEEVNVQEAPVQVAVEPEIKIEEPVVEEIPEVVEEVQEEPVVEETPVIEEIPEVVEEVQEEPVVEELQLEEDSEGGRHYNKKRNRR